MVLRPVPGGDLKWKPMKEQCSLAWGGNILADQNTLYFMSLLRSLVFEHASCISLFYSLYVFKYRHLNALHMQL
jgi:hypothetical protein